MYRMPRSKVSQSNMKPQTAEAVLILPDIRSAHNIGSIFRTADAVGISKIYLGGYSPRPLDQFMRPQPEIAKTALGAEKTIPWKYYKNPKAIFTRIKKEGFHIVAIEQAEASVDYRKVKLHPKTAIVLGTEVTGISKPLLKLCDTIAEIPMRGEKESLNVSVAAGVALFGILKP